MNTVRFIFATCTHTLRAHNSAVHICTYCVHTTRPYIFAASHCANATGPYIFAATACTQHGITYLQPRNTVVHTCSHCAHTTRPYILAASARTQHDRTYLQLLRAHSTAVQLRACTFKMPLQCLIFIYDPKKSINITNKIK